MAKKKTQKRSKLAPALLLAGAAGGIVTALRKRGGKASEQLQQAAGQAAEAASQVADRAKEAAPSQVTEAIENVQDKVSGGDEGTGATQPADESTRRYAAPAEAGSQPPAQPDNSPSDATVIRDTASGLDEGLHTKPHDLPPDVVMPDVSDDDPAVRDAEAAAAADAGAIGGNADVLANDEPGFPTDPARRPVIEGAGDPDEQTLEDYDRDLGGNRETQA